MTGSPRGPRGASRDWRADLPMNGDGGLRFSLILCVFYFQRAFIFITLSTLFKSRTALANHQSHLPGKNRIERSFKPRERSQKCQGRELLTQNALLGSSSPPLWPEGAIHPLLLLFALREEVSASETISRRHSFLAPGCLAFVAQVSRTVSAQLRSGTMSSLPNQCYAPTWPLLRKSSFRTALLLRGPFPHKACYQSSSLYQHHCVYLGGKSIGVEI